MVSATEGLKVCNRCGQALPYMCFTKDSRVPNGLRPRCRECRSLDHYEYYNQGGGGKEKKDKYYLVHRDERLPKMRGKWGPSRYNPNKQPARKAVFRAVQSGILAKPDRCHKCEKIGEVTAHHWHGYDKAHYLDVVWECMQCHILTDNPEFEKRLEEYKKEVYCGKC